LVGAINFVPLILVVRVFGSESWGKVIYYYSFAGVMSSLSDLGLSTAYNKFLAAEDDSKNIFAFLVLKIILIFLYVLIFAVVYLLKFKYNTADSMLLKIGFLAILLELFAGFFTATMVGKRDFFYLSLVEIISACVFFIYIAGICLVKSNIYLLAYSQAVVPMITIICGFSYFGKKDLFKFSVPQFRYFKKYASYSLPIGFSSICERLLSYFDKIVLGSLLGTDEVGFYQIAQQCYAGVDRFIKPVTSTMFTEIVHRIANNPSFFRKQFKNLVETLNFAGAIFVIIIVFAAKPVVQLFFGDENLRSAFILQFFALSVMGRLFWRPYNNVIFAIEKHRLITALIPLNLAFMIACYYLLVPLKTGESFYLGAAALPITEFITWLLPIGFLRIIILKKQYGDIHMWDIILKIWLPLLFVVLTGYYFDYSLWLLPVELAVFILAAFYMNILKKDRLAYLYSPFKIK
jgi:O-antigen/teichoic acid export membrane protein